jgi:hypothetical protein
MTTLMEPAPVVAEKTEHSSLPRHVYVLSMALAVVAAITAAATYFIPDILLGPPVTNGNARGTALVMMSLAVPVLLISIAFAARGSWRAMYFWMGSVFYVAYNAFLLLFLTPFNRLFLLNVATASLALFAGMSLFLAFDTHLLLGQMRKPPFRGLAVFVWVIVAFNAVAWLAEIVPALLADDPLTLVEGTGVATNAIYVQDLVFWLPTMALAAWGVWNQRSMGVFLTGSWLLFGAIESVGVAVDQWYGHQADPTSSFASIDAMYVMAGLFVVNVIGVYFYLRSPGRSPAHTSR